MAKKVSKHSRAARRGEDDVDDSEAKTLAQEKSSAPDDLKSTFIRKTITNENLLQKKMENSRIKKHNRKKSNSLKSKIERSEKLDGILANKISQSIERNSYVTRLRKADWDLVNREIALSKKRAANDSSADKEPAKDPEKEAEDAYVDLFFKDTEEEEEQLSKPKNDESVKDLAGTNRFNLLEETEA